MCSINDKPEITNLYPLREKAVCAFRRAARMSLPLDPVLELGPNLS